MGQQAGRPSPGTPLRDEGAELHISGAAINKASQNWCEEVTHPPGTQRDLCSPPAATLPLVPFFLRCRDQRVPETIVDVTAWHWLCKERTNMWVWCGSGTIALKPQHSLFGEHLGWGKPSKTRFKGQLLRRRYLDAPSPSLCIWAMQRANTATLVNRNRLSFQKLCKNVSD